MSYKKKIELKNPQQIKMLFWTVFVASKGCVNRVKIILQLKQLPSNTNQLSEQLGLDYKVVERHLEVLEKYELVIKVGNSYGIIYFPSLLLESNLNLFEKIVGESKNCTENSSKNVI